MQIVGYVAILLILTPNGYARSHKAYSDTFVCLYDALLGLKDSSFKNLFESANEERLAIT